MLLGIIGGTGLGDVFLHELGAANVETHNLDSPFGPPSAPVITGTLDGVQLALLRRHGPGHIHNPRSVPSRANIHALKQLGCTHILASGATGSLRDHIHPGELVICDQLIDRTDRRSRTFFDCAAVHVEFADPFCPIMRNWLIKATHSLSGVTVHQKGTYVCMEGPSFSTRAESHLYRQWGADVVGMTALPEARLAREAEMAYALIALPTDYDCWKPTPEGMSPSSLLHEILNNLQRATSACVKLIRAAVADAASLAAQPSPAHRALDLAIWSNRNKIPREEVERLRVIWGRHFA